MLNITAKSNRIRSAVVAMLFVAIFGFVLVSQAKADEWDKKTVVTFSGPVEIPGKVLPAGTYVFRLLNSASNRNIVQIFDKDEKQLFATMLAIPDYRLQPSDKPVIRFEERASGSPEAIKAWFYPGDVYGQQFVYPHKRAVELAKRTNQNVLSMPNELNQNISTPAKSASEPSVQAMEKAEVTGVKPSGEPIQLAQAVASKPENGNSAATPTESNAAQSSASSSNTPNASTANTTTQAAAAQTHPKRLPQTGSELPLLSLLGACSLGAAMIARYFRRVL
ncbi:MAG TPA: LPXTG cell wall anchor domain-containing protein [Bryobacteraceae bacterium]|nr:LPXTG cell wall anchor domain-containing protein [Bryobacteraceae bacterium]